MVYQIVLAEPGKEWTVRSSFFARGEDMDIVLRWRSGKGLQTLRGGAEL